MQNLMYQLLIFVPVQMVYTVSYLTWVFYIDHAYSHFALYLLGIVCVGGDGIVNEVSMYQLHPWVPFNFFFTSMSIFPSIDLCFLVYLIAY
jgi:hypothetical protein